MGPPLFKTILHSRLVAFITNFSAILLAAAGYFYLSDQTVPYHVETGKTGRVSEALTELSPDFLASADFSSHLPLIIFIPDSKTDSARQPAEGRLRLVDGPGPVNRPDDRPSAELTAVLSRFGEAAAREGKARFEVRASGAARTTLLGLPATDTWLLEGSDDDPAMLRNYLAYTLGREVMDGRAPRIRWCEVLIQTEAGLIYQGLHLLSEHPSSVTGGESGSLALRYEPGVGSEPPGLHLAGGAFRPFTAGAAVSELSRAEEKINQVQTVINAGDPDIFFNYRGLLDEASCVNTYILNQFMMNYRGRELPVAVHMTEGRKLSLGPVWNFDLAVDNTVKPPADANQDAAGSLWLPRLLTGAEFVERYRARYYQLVRSVLDPKRVNDLVDETVLFLGPALVRDWARWREAYSGTDGQKLAPLLTENGRALIRTSTSYDQETIKIKTRLRANDQAIRQGLQELRWQPGLLGSDTRRWRNAVLAVVFVGAFFTVVALARRRY